MKIYNHKRKVPEPQKEKIQPIYTLIHYLNKQCPISHFKYHQGTF